MIPYHGLPITPLAAAKDIIRGRHVLVPWRRRDQLPLAIELAQSFAVDNSAWSFYRSGQIPGWNRYYEWVDSIKDLPNFDFAIIPDVIDGTTEENNALLDAWPHGKRVGVPVWHLHESLERLQWLAHHYPRVALGSSGRYIRVGSDEWEARMRQAMLAVCDARGRPVCKLHGLRMLNWRVFERFPFASSDSTNIARNIGIDRKWRGAQDPCERSQRGEILARRIESHQASAACQEQDAEAKLLEMSKNGFVPHRHRVMAQIAMAQLLTRARSGAPEGPIPITVDRRGYPVLNGASLFKQDEPECRQDEPECKQDQPACRQDGPE